MMAPMLGAGHGAFQCSRQKPQAPQEAEFLLESDMRESLGNHFLLSFVRPGALE